MKKPSPPSSSVTRTTGPYSGKRKRGASASGSAAASRATKRNPRPLPPPVVHAPPRSEPLVVDVVCRFCNRDRAIWAPNCCKIRSYCGHCKTSVENLGTGCPCCGSPVKPTWEEAAWAPAAGGGAQGGDAPAPPQ